MGRRGSSTALRPATTVRRGARHVWQHPSLASKLAWSLWALCMALLGVMCAGSGFSSTALIASLLLLGMPTVGTIVAAHRPGNAIGWLFLGLPVLWIFTLVPGAYLGDGGWVWAIWVGSWVWPAAIIATLTFPFLLFPNGRLLSPRWRVIFWLTVIAVTFTSAAGAFGPREMRTDPPMENPARIDAVAHIGSTSAYAALGVVGPLVILILLIAPVTSLVLRLRRSHGGERHQIRWFSYTASLLMVGLTFVAVAGAIVPAVVGSGDDIAGAVIFIGGPVVALVGFPVAVGVAILRHRLYDIDRIVNRTLVYAVLSTSLVAIYLGLVLGGGAAVRGVLDASSSLVTAGSTLAVAALFQPLQRRIQRVVDRRFFRHKYDAAQTIERFSAHLRDEVELATLGAELQAVAVRTMQPAHVSLWLRPSVQRPRL